MNSTSPSKSPERSISNEFMSNECERAIDIDIGMEVPKSDGEPETTGNLVACVGRFVGSFVIACAGVGSSVETGGSVGHRVGS